MEITVTHIIKLDSSIMEILTALAKGNVSEKVTTKVEKTEKVEPKEEKVIIKNTETVVNDEPPFETDVKAEPKYTKDELRAEALKVKAKKGTMYVKKILSSFNVSGITELDDNNIDKCMEAFKGEL